MYDVPDVGVSALLKATVLGRTQPTNACLCCEMVSISSQSSFFALTLVSFSYLLDRQIGEIKLDLKMAICVTLFTLLVTVQPFRESQQG